MLDSNGSFDNPFFQDKKIVKIDCKWKGQEYSKDAFGFTHAEYVCSFILKENPEAEIVLVPIVRKNKIDIAVHEANKQHDRTLMVYFIGGEPLMAFNLMKDVVDYAKKKCQETNLICKFSTTINGTLVTDEVIDFFVENTFEVKVSLDGPEYVQNLNRRDYAGTGSFEKIMKNLPLLRKYEQETGNQISVASVVTSNNYQYYAESFQFLLDLGIKKLESGIDYYCSWSDEQIQGLREQM